MIDLEAIRARDACVRFMDYATAGDIDRRALLAHVDELREAAGKVTCERCGGSTCAPEHGRGIPAPGTCPDCDDLRRLLEEKP